MNVKDLKENDVISFWGNDGEELFRFIRTKRTNILVEKVSGSENNLIQQSYGGLYNLLIQDSKEFQVVVGAKFNKKYFNL